MLNEEELYSAHIQCEDATSTGNECFIFIRMQQKKLHKASVRFGKRRKNLSTR
jgi:hypothetical protein